MAVVTSVVILVIAVAAVIVTDSVLVALIIMVFAAIGVNNCFNVYFVGGGVTVVFGYLDSSNDVLLLFFLLQVFFLALWIFVMVLIAAVAGISFDLLLHSLERGLIF